jgi:hypothetical protein
VATPSQAWKKLARSKLVTVERVDPLPSVEFQSFVTGSLAEHLSLQVDSRIAGKVPATAWPLHNGSVYNAGNWAAGVNLTCCSREIQRGTAVSPLHVIGAKHAPPPTNISFLGSDNTVVSRTIVSRLDLGTPGDLGIDIQVCRLNAALPASVTPVKVFPTDWASKLVHIEYFIPIAILNQFEELLVHEWWSITDYGWIVWQDAKQTADRMAFNKHLIIYDSGSPAFVLVNGTSVFRGVVTGTLGGSDISANYAAVNAAMTTLGGGYQLTDVDLSGFPDYD